MKRVLAGVAFLFSVGLAIAAIQVTPPNNTGTIEGRVMRSDFSEGIPGVQISLQSPIVLQPSAVYTPSPDLTPDMKQQIDALVSSAPPDIEPELL